MTREERLALIGETFEMETSELSEEVELANLRNWDSMAKLSLIVLMDDEFGKKLSGEQIRSFITIKDILDFMG